jgi:hypothetical protein
VCNVGLQTSPIVVQFASVTHATQVLVVVSQNGVFRSMAQSVSAVQRTQACVVMSQMGRLVFAQFALPKHATQLFVVVSQ